MTDTRDQRLLTDAAAQLADVITRTDTPPYRHDGIVVHAAAAARHLTRATGRPTTPNPRPDPSPGAADVDAVERDLRGALRSLALLSPVTFDTDGVLDTIRELQSALAATG